MKDIFIEIKNSVIATIVFAIILCGIYPLIVYGAGQLFFPNKANGSLIEGKDRRLVGSELLGQMFSGEKYFHPRPSAAGTGYDATASGASNLGPSNPLLLADVRARVAAYRRLNGLAANTPVPVDAVTASASGLDPAISPANARLQAPRVARARGLSLARVLTLVRANTDGRSLGILGEPGVNVLELNLALDKGR